MDPPPDPADFVTNLVLDTLLADFESSNHVDRPPPDVSPLVQQVWGQCPIAAKIKTWRTTLKSREDLLVALHPITIDAFLHALEASVQSPTANRKTPTNLPATPIPKLSSKGNLPPKSLTSTGARSALSERTNQIKPTTTPSSLSSHQTRPPPSASSSHRTNIPNSKGQPSTTKSKGKGKQQLTSAPADESASEPEEQGLSDDQGNGSEGDDEEDDVFGPKKLTANDRRRALNQQVSGHAAWKKAQAISKDPRAKTEVDFFERGPIGQWPLDVRRWEISFCGHVRRKVRQACGIPDRQITSWPAKTNALRLDPTFQAYLKYHLEDATDDDHNSGIIERIKDIFLGDRALMKELRQSGTPYWSERWLVYRIKTYFRNTATDWRKLQTEEGVQEKEASHREGRWDQRQTTRASQCIRGFAYLQQQYPRLPNSALQTFKDCYMSDSFSGPSDDEERAKWLKSLGADVDRQGKKTTVYSRKGKGTPIYETGYVAWRTLQYAWLVKRSRGKFQEHLSDKSAERVLKVKNPRWARIRWIPPPNPLFRPGWVKGIRDHYAEDSTPYEALEDWGTYDADDEVLQDLMDKVAECMEEEARENNLPNPFTVMVPQVKTRIVKRPPPTEAGDETFDQNPGYVELEVVESDDADFGMESWSAEPPSMGDRSAEVFVRPTEMVSAGAPEVEERSSESETHQTSVATNSRKRKIIQDSDEEETLSAKSKRSREILVHTVPPPPSPDLNRKSPPNIIHQPSPTFHFGVPPRPNSDHSLPGPSPDHPHSDNMGGDVDGVRMDDEDVPVEEQAIPAPSSKKEKVIAKSLKLITRPVNGGLGGVAAAPGPSARGLRARKTAVNYKAMMD